MAASRASTSGNAVRARTRALTPWSSAMRRARAPGRLATTRTTSSPASSNASRFDPRPETSTPIRIGSSGEANARVASLEGEDPADASRLGERGERSLDAPLGDDRRHPDPDVEGPNHLLVGNVAALLDEAEDRRHRPGAGLDLDTQAVGQGARDVSLPAPAGDVGECMDVVPRRAQRPSQNAHLVEVRPVRLQERIPDRAAVVGHWLRPQRP